MWKVAFTAEFEDWIDTLTKEQQADVQASLDLLELEGPQLSRPHADTLSGSRHNNMKELRTQSSGKPLRSFFAFDPTRTAIVLLGGDKSGDKKFYERMIRKADDLYDLHLANLNKKGAS